MSSVKIKKIKFFLKMPIVFFLPENIRAAGARAHFMRYIFFSIQFISFHFISIQRDENYETLRMITK